MLPTGFATLRDAFLFIAGLTLIGYEVFIAVEVRPLVLAAGLSMIGLPVAFGADERRKGSKP